MGMALALHISVALALWLVAPLKLNTADIEPIEVTMEAPQAASQAAPPVEKPEPAVPKAAAVPQPPPPSPPPAPVLRAPAPAPLGIAPPPSRDADKSAPQPRQDHPEPQQQALARPKEEPPPAPPIEKVLPKIDAPPPPLTMQDFVKIAPPPPPAEVVKPLPRQVEPAPPQRQTLRPSPLPTKPAPSPDDNSSSGFVNPADVYVKTRVQDQYVWEVIRRFSQFLPDLRQKNEGGTVRLRFVIARDGKLLDVSIAHSSGVMALDKGLLEAVRAAAPYPPLPSEFTGPSATFTQNITAKR